MTGRTSRNVACVGPRDLFERIEKIEMRMIRVRMSELSNTPQTSLVPYIVMTDNDDLAMPAGGR